VPLRVDKVLPIQCRMARPGLGLSIRKLAIAARTPNVTIPGQKSKTTAALCETPDQSKLVMLDLGDSSNRIRFSAV
jgi:hypothetical protein